ncbi:MAG: NUDIX hydrolase [Deltaproteobacteria bacterium]|nr:MAG: NUDIX hydrolase [Deltaproteobacteria bacterium]
MGTQVIDIEVVSDRTAESRCDEGFLHLRRLLVRNRRADGTVSEVYPVDVVDRPQLDAVAVVVWRRGATGQVEVLLRQTLRPAALLRRDRNPPLPDPRPYLALYEIVAGVLEAEDRGEAGLRARAAAECWEEAGLKVHPEEVELLGAPFFVAPGILSEKIFLTAVDAGRRALQPPPGDGSPLEESGALRWMALDEAIRCCVAGEIEDAKTEIGLRRLAEALPGGGRPLIA